MKRFFAVFAIVFAMFAVWLRFLPQPFYKTTGVFPDDAQAVVYCRSSSLQSVGVGNGCLVGCNVQSLAQVLEKCSNVDGVSVRFRGSWENFCFLQRWFSVRQAEVLSVANVTVVCGYSNKICGGVVLDGKTVNIQMAFDGETVTVGSPLILDSY